MGAAGAAANFCCVGEIFYNKKDSWRRELLCQYEYLQGWKNLKP